MPADVFDNSFITALSAGINASQPTIPVNSAASAALAAGVTAGAQFRIIVDAERMLVTAGASTTTWTVTRGIEGTTAVAHNSGAAVSHILTVGGFLNHHTIHEPGGADPFTLLDDTNFNVVAKDGLATRPSMRTLGTGAQQAAAGNAPPNPHQVSHQPGGTDALVNLTDASVATANKDGAVGTPSMRTLGTGTLQAASGADARLSDSRNPLAHAATHRYTGSDPVYSLAPTAKTADYAATVGDLVLMSGVHTVTLQSTPANNVQIGVVALSGQVTIARGGATDTITVSGVTNQTSFAIQTGSSVILTYLNGVWYALQSTASSGGGGGGGGGTGGMTPTSQNIDYLASANQLVLMTGAHTVTLPTGPPPGTQVALYALTNPCTLARSGTDTIEFNGPPTVNTLTVPQGEMYTLEYLNGVWYGAGVIAGSLAPPARMYLNTNQTGIANAAWSKINLDTKSYDAGGNCDLTNHRYICPTSGYYLVSGGANGLTAGSWLVGVYKNGSLTAEGSFTTANTESVVSDVIQCNAGDYIELYIFNQTGAALSIEGAGVSFYTYLAVAQVGQLGAPPAGQGIATQARMYRAAAITTVGSTWTKIPFDTVDYDPGNNTQTANNRYICPVTGYYQVNGVVSVVSSASGQVVTIMTAKNGTQVSEGGSATASASGQGLDAVTMDVLFCQAGDYIELQYYCSAAGLAMQVGSSMHLSVVQVVGTNAVGALSPTAQTADYTAGPGQLVVMTGAHNVNLPSAPQAGSQVGVYALTANTTVNRAGTDTINYNNTPSLTNVQIPAGSSVVFSYLGGVWYCASPNATNLAPPARAYRVAAIQVGTSNVKIPVDTKSYDPGGNMDIANGRYVCPQAGNYEVSAQVDVVANAVGQSALAMIMKNGSTVVAYGSSNYSGGSGAGMVSVVNDFVQCNAGDVLELWASSSTASLNANVNNPSLCYLSVAQVSGLGAPTPGQGQATVARAYRNAAFSLGTVNAKIALDTITFDPGNNFSIPNSRYVCPVTGYYAVDYNVIATATAGAQYLSGSIYKNGVLQDDTQDWASSNGSMTVSGSDVIFCQAGDYLELWAASNATTGVPGPGYVYMSVAQVGGANVIGALSPTAQTGNYTAGPGQLVMMTGQNTVTLPSAPQAGTQVGVNSLTATTAIARSGGDTINLNGTAGQTTVYVPQGTTTILTYLNGVWYAAAPPVGTLAPPARAYRNAALSLNSAVYNKISLDTKSFDPGGNMDVTTNGRYVCPTAGYYHITGIVDVNVTTAGLVFACIFKNGVITVEGDAVSSPVIGQCVVNVADTLQCQAGDYLELYVYTGAAESLNVGLATRNVLAVSQVAAVGAPNVSQGQGLATQARAYRNASYSLTANVWGKVSVDTVTFDPGSNISTANGRYVCPVTGYYQVIGEMNIGVPTASTNTLVTAIYKNGVQVSIGSAVFANQVGGGAGLSTEIEDIIFCQAGDFIELWGLANVAVSPSAGNQLLNYLSVTQVGGTNLVAALSPTAQTAPYTAGVGQLVMMTGANAVTLPSAPQAGTQVGINALTNSVPVNRGGTDTINYSGTGSLTTFTVPQGTTVVMTYLNGVWYGAGPTQTNLAPPARAYRSAAFTVPTSPITKIPFDTKSYDPGGAMDVTTNNRYICPTAGFYAVDAGYEMAATAGSGIIILIYKNGALYSQAEVVTSVTTTTGATISDIVQCNAGDYLEIWCYSGTAGAMNVSTSSNWFSVTQVAGIGAPMPQPGQGIPTQARAYRNTALNTPAAAWAKIPIDTNVFDPGGNIQTANGRYVSPTTGYYQVYGQVSVVSGASDSVIAGIYVNGALRTSGSRNYSTSSSSVVNADVADIIQVNAGDIVELWTITTTADALNLGSNNNYLSVVQIAGTNLVGALSPTAQTAAYSAGAGQLVLMTGANTVTLPNAPQNGTQVGVNALTSGVPVNRAGTDTINNAGTPGLTVFTVPQGTTTILTYLGGVWYTLQSGGGGGGGTSGPSTTMSARAYRNAAFTSTAASVTKIPLDTVDYDTSGMVQLANGRMVAPVAGYYQIAGEAMLSGLSASVALQMTAFIYVNGSTRSAGSEVPYSDINGHVRANVSDTLKLNAGDQVELYVFTTGAYSLNTTAYPGATNYLSMALLASLPGTVGPATPARAYRSAAWTTPGVGNNKVPFDTVSYDPGGNFSLANSRYICPATGYYQVNSTMTCGGATSSTAQFQAVIAKNGTAVSAGDSFAGQPGGVALTIGDIIPCNAGDYLEVDIWTNGAYAMSPGAQVLWMSVVQVGNLASTPVSTCTARAYRNAAWNTSNSAWAQVSLDTVSFDTSGMVTLSNGRVVAPVAGYYQVDGEVSATSSAAGQFLEVGVWKNGAPVSGTQGVLGAMGVSSAASQPLVAVTSGKIYMNAGDYLQLMNNANMAIAANAGADFYGYLSIALLTPLSGTAGPVTAARAYRNAAFTPTSNAFTRVPFDTIAYDAGNNYSTATSRYTCPATGTYEVTCTLASMTIQTTAQRLYLSILKNGTEVARGNDNTWRGMTVGDNISLTVNDIVQCNAGDYIEINFFCGAGTAPTTQTGNPYSFLSVALVGNSMNFTTAGGDLKGTYPNPVLAPAVVTSLPSSPVDGQIIHFLADATNGVVWQLKYRAASASAYKWEFVGGSSLFSRVQTQETSTAGANVWSNLATLGPDIILPLNGDYEIEWGATAYEATGAAPIMMAVADASVSLQPVTSTTCMWRYNNQMTHMVEDRVTGQIAGHTLRCAYNNNAAGQTSTWASRFFRLRPIRVG